MSSNTEKTQPIPTENLNETLTLVSPERFDDTSQNRRGNYYIAVGNIMKGYVDLLSTSIHHDPDKDDEIKRKVVAGFTDTARFLAAEVPEVGSPEHSLQSALISAYPRLSEYRAAVLILETYGYQALKLPEYRRIQMKARDIQYGIGKVAAKTLAVLKIKSAPREPEADSDSLRIAS